MEYSHPSSPLPSPWQATPSHSQGSPLGSDLGWLGDDPDTLWSGDPFNERNKRSPSRNRNSKEEKKGVVIILGHSDFGGLPKEESCKCNMPTNKIKVRTYLVGGKNTCSLMFRDPGLLEDYFQKTYHGIIDMEDDAIIELLTTAKKSYRSSKITRFGNFEDRFSHKDKEAYFNSKVLMNTDLKSFCERIWVFHGERPREGIVLLITKNKGIVQFERLYEMDMRNPLFQLEKSTLIGDMEYRGIERLTIIDHACTVYDKDMCPEFRDALRLDKFGGKSKQIKIMNQSKKKRRKTKRKRRNQIKRIV
jgi:hypothetical protein